MTSTPDRPRSAASPLAPQPDSTLKTQPETPLKAQAHTPLETQPETPLRAQPNTPLETPLPPQPEAPAETALETPPATLPSGAAAYTLNDTPVERDRFYALACDPARSVVVEACAGAGKTWMLVSRILRALLAGTAPQDIVAITFTRKAAGEMRARLNEWLHEFAHCDAQGRELALRQRGLSADEARALAPTLATLQQRLLQAGRTVEIRTFHAWFSQLLRAAPLELLQAQGLSPELQLVEDESDLLPELWQRFHAAVLGDETLLAHYRALSLEHGRNKLQGWLQAAFDKRVEIRLAHQEGRLLDSMPGVAAVAPELAAFAHPLEAFAPMRADLQALAIDLGQSGKATPRKAATAIEMALQHDDHTALSAVWQALFTADGSPRKHLGDAPGLSYLLDRLLRLRQALDQHHARAWHQQMCGLALVLLEQFEQLKRERGLVDMNDLERGALALLGDAGLSGWIQERLDSQVRHLLIDEFQDTSPLQWHALFAWLSSYVGAGGGASGQRPPSVFIVGDPKQSIYRFRRAEPRVFAAARDFVRAELGGVLLACDHTRRNSPQVLAAVNAVFEQASREQQYSGFRAHTTESGAGDALDGVFHLVEEADADGDADAAGDGDQSPAINVTRAGALPGPRAGDLPGPRAGDLPGPRSGERRGLLESDAGQRPPGAPLDVADRGHASLSLPTTAAAHELQALSSQPRDPESWRPSLTEPRREPELHRREAEAQRIGASIAALLQSGQVDPGDIFVLARKREGLRVLAQVLKGLGIAHAAPEDMPLRDAPDVRDLLALLDALASSGHQLSLAHALRSPIFGVSESDLLWLAEQGRSVRWLRAQAAISDDAGASHAAESDRAALASSPGSRAALPVKSAPAAAVQADLFADAQGDLFADVAPPPVAWSSDSTPERSDEPPVARSATHASAAPVAPSATHASAAPAAPSVVPASAAPVAPSATHASTALAAPSSMLASAAPAAPSPMLASAASTASSPAHASASPAPSSVSAASNDSRSWWEVLLSSPPHALSEPLQRAQRLLTRWADMAARCSPHDLLDDIVHEGDLIARLAAAVPPSERRARLHAVDALLSLALELDGGRYAGLYGFVRALKSRALKLAAPAEPDAVQLLTVHGAKGLEAKVVILMDAEAGPARAEHMALAISWPVHEPVPRTVAFIVSETRPPPSLQALLDDEREQRQREELNALYVAMTRARHRLVLSRTPARRAPSTATWWSRVEPVSQPLSVAPLSADATQAPPPAVLKRLPTVAPLPAPEVEAAQPLSIGLSPEALDESAALGEALHRVLEWHSGPQGALHPVERLMASAAQMYGLDARREERLQRSVRAILESEACAPFFDASQLEWQGNEVPVGFGDADLRLDRLVRRRAQGDGPAVWWVLDYKLHPAPQGNPEYIAQLRRYREAVMALQPGEPVRCAFITGQGRLIDCTDAVSA